MQLYPIYKDPLRDINKMAVALPFQLTWVLYSAACTLHFCFTESSYKADITHPTQGKNTTHFNLNGKMGKQYPAMP